MTSTISLNALFAEPLQDWYLFFEIAAHCLCDPFFSDNIIKSPLEAGRRCLVQTFGHINPRFTYAISPVSYASASVECATGIEYLMFFTHVDIPKSVHRDFQKTSLVFRDAPSRVCETRKLLVCRRSTSSPLFVAGSSSSIHILAGAPRGHRAPSARILRIGGM